MGEALSLNSLVEETVGLSWTVKGRGGGIQDNQTVQEGETLQGQGPGRAKALKRDSSAPAQNRGSEGCEREKRSVKPEGLHEKLTASRGR